MTNLIPMAGEGARFKQKGYPDPKPCIPVGGRPMFLQAIRCLPEAEAWVFVCRKEHATDYPLSRWIQETVPGARIIFLERPTEGQACSCLEGIAHIDLEAPLLIGTIDNGMVWDRGRYRTLRDDPETDAIIWTFRNHAAALERPRMYSWVAVNGNRAERVSLKEPVSSEPKQDHAVMGTFWFRKASDFAKAARRIIAEDRRTNGEFYVDTCLDAMIRAGRRVRVFEVSRYLSWGTPEDLETFHYWQNFFDQVPDHPYRKNRDPDVVKGTPDAKPRSLHRSPLL